MRVNIIGANPPFIPEEGENWIVNLAFVNYYEKHKLHKVFIMDGINGLSNVRQGGIPRETVLEWLTECGARVVTPHYEEGLYLTDPFPLEQIKERYDLLYFKSTIAYMLAYAALHNYDDVHLVGIHQSNHLEYFFERPAVEYWIGVLRGQGATITSHDGKETRLFGGRPAFGGRALYGYECKEKKALKQSRKAQEKLRKRFGS